MAHRATNNEVTKISAKCREPKLATPTMLP